MNLPEVLSIIATVVGATWVLRSKLSDIETALKAHVAQDDQRHEDLKARVVKLEDYRGRR